MIRVSPCSIPSMVRLKGAWKRGRRSSSSTTRQELASIETVAMCGPITAGIQDRIIRYGSGAPDRDAMHGFQLRSWFWNYYFYGKDWYYQRADDPPIGFSTKSVKQRAKRVGIADGEASNGPVVCSSSPRQRYRRCSWASTGLGPARDAACSPLRHLQGAIG